MPSPTRRGDGFDFVRGEVLGLVDDHELVGDGAAADVGEGFEDEFAGVEVAFELGFDVGGFAGVDAAVGEEEFEVVEDGLHPGGEFFVLGAGEVADVAAHGHDGSGDQEAFVAEPALSWKHLCMPAARARRVLPVPAVPMRVTMLDVVIEQQVEGHDLLEVAWDDAEDGLFGSRAVAGRRRGWARSGRGRSGILRRAALRRTILVGAEFGVEAGDERDR